MEAWFVEQPALSEELEVAETRLMEAKTRYLQELDRVCAHSSPRVAFERRLDYVSQTSPWYVACGMISGEPCSLHDDDDDDDNEGLKIHSYRHIRVCFGVGGWDKGLPREGPWKCCRVPRSRP
jgi:hypothetical protein